MMFISAFILDRRSASVRQCLRNAQDMHRNIMSGFGNNGSNSEGSRLGVLYRLVDSGTDIKLYVLSPVLPNWNSFEEKGFYIEDTPKEVSYVSSVTGAGNRFGFDLLCIPSKKEKREGKNSRRILLKTEEERVEWLRKKAEQNGFSLLWVREEGGSKVMVKTKHSSTEAWHGGIRFRGELVVLDAALFSKAFQKGIGAGKAYGFGMLLLLPPRG